MLEQLSEELKRRTHVAGLFSNHASTLRLVRVVLMEISKDRATNRKVLTMEPGFRAAWRAIQRKGLNGPFHTSSFPFILHSISEREEAKEAKGSFCRHSSTHKACHRSCHRVEAYSWTPHSTVAPTRPDGWSGSL
jgi:Transposase, Mutator family